MTKKTERHIWAAVGTFLFMLLVFLLLWLIRLSAVVPEQEEGIELAFLEEMPDTGGYPSDAPNPSPVPEDAPAAPAAPAVSQPTPATPPEHIVSEEETLAIERARKEKEEREAAERARKQKEAEAIAKANAMSSLFGNTGNNAQTGSGSQGAGQKGNPVGHGTFGGDSRIKGLNGRNLIGTLPDPVGNFQQNGVVVVKIRVNQEGQVISAVETTGTNTSDKIMIKSAIDAAKKTKWSKDTKEAEGTIKYTFIIK